MSEHERFRFRDVGELASRVAALGVDLPLSEDGSVLRRPVSIGLTVAPNALAVHPMEGCDGLTNGEPGPLTVRRYERFSAGGAGLLWFEATAVVAEGRANPRQLWLNADTAPAFARLLDLSRRVAADSAGIRPICVLQLTHSGRYSKPVDARAPIVPQRDPLLDPVTGVTSDAAVVEDEHLDWLIGQYAETARLAYEIGFDGVDVKACHRYLISELLAAHTRPGRYGGDFVSRSRFLLDVVERVRPLAGARQFVATRLNVYDGHPFPYGFGVDRRDPTEPDLSEAVELVGALAARGVALINVTAGNPYFTPHINRPHDVPILQGRLADEHPLVGVSRLLGFARSIKQAAPGVSIVGTGYSWLRQLQGAAMAGTVGAGWCDLAGAGRGAFAYPDFARDLLADGRLDARKVCVACSRCTQIMRDGGESGCVIRDREVYEPIYRAGREANP